MSTPYSQFSSLTLEQVDELFRKYDRNGDGVITKDELTGFFAQLDCPSSQSKSQASKSLPSSKTPPPKKNTNSKPNKNTDSHALAPKATSKPQQVPKEKVKPKAKGSETEANKQKKVKEPKKNHGGKANEHPLNQLPAMMMCEDHKAQKAKGKDKPKNEPNMCLNREHLKDIFREHDVDCDGYLDYGELTMAFHFLDPVLPCYKARDGIAHADADGDGRISEAEFDKLIDFAEQLYGDELVF